MVDEPDVDARPPLVLRASATYAPRTMSRPTASARTSSRSPLTRPPVLAGPRRGGAKEPPGKSEPVPAPAPGAAVASVPNFKIGDKAVHPAHGVGEVTAI